ncbi:hypothetical protein E4U57_000685 [Claviceps arundinis]|uniref:non-specific serine/threonine protein kinase n=1 Tax=Claviceps arundinis TaxID=1623583 RepID=A0ABQ7PLT0_9HYPO|nr:hypothetical protein E4U57_000685 [Claviceps arundinis]
MPNLMRAVLANAGGRLSRLFVTLSKPPLAKPAPRQFLEEPDNYKPGGYHPVSLGDTFDSNRYSILRKLGYGLYSTVWLARDSKCQRFVALKVLRADCYGRPHHAFEREVLEKIREVSRESSHEGPNYLSPLLDQFTHKGPNGDHVCLTFDVLGHDLYIEAAMYKGRRLPVKAAKEIITNDDVSEYLECVPPRTTDGQNGAIIPLQEIITTVSEKASLHVRIIDFGVGTYRNVPANRSSRKPTDLAKFELRLASWRNKHLGEVIQPLALRAPEVTLGASWDTGVDIWNLGCLVIEFVHGYVIFPGSESEKGGWSAEEDHLARIVKVLGPFPSSLLKKGRRSAELFDEKGRLVRGPSMERSSLECMLNGSVKPYKRPSDMSKKEFDVFIDFLKGMLEIDPSKRKSAAQLLQHEWLS